MAYQFELESDAEAPFTDALSTEIVEFFLGFDLENDVAVLMSVMLVPIDEAHDLRFGIRRKQISQDWKVTAPDYSVEAVSAYIPKQQRQAVREKIAAAVVALLDKVAPANVTMETYYPGLDAKALAKYDTIVNAMARCRFELADRFRDGTTLKDYWLFTKQVYNEA